MKSDKQLLKEHANEDWYTVLEQMEQDQSRISRRGSTSR